MQIGASDYLVKPIDEEELKRVIAKVIGLIRESQRDSAQVEKMALRALQREAAEVMKCLLEEKDYPGSFLEEYPFLADYSACALVLCHPVGIEGNMPQAGAHRHSPGPSFKEILIPLREEVCLVLWERIRPYSLREQIAVLRKDLFRACRCRFFYTTRAKEEDIQSVMKRAFQAMEAGFYKEEEDVEATASTEIDMRKELTMPDIQEAMELLARSHDASLLHQTISTQLSLVLEKKISPVSMSEMLFDTFIAVKVFLTKTWPQEAMETSRKIHLWTFLGCFGPGELTRTTKEKIEEIEAFVQTQGKPGEDQQLIGRVQKYTLTHYPDHELTLQMVADEVGMNRTYFSGLFKKLTGEGYWDYLTRVRMEKAKTLLRDTNAPQKLISEKVGYSSEFHFSRKFK